MADEAAGTGEPSSSTQPRAEPGAESPQTAGERSSAGVTLAAGVTLVSPGEESDAATGSTEEQRRSLDAFGALGQGLADPEKAGRGSAVGKEIAFDGPGGAIRAFLAVGEDKPRGAGAGLSFDESELAPPTPEIRLGLREPADASNGVTAVAPRSDKSEVPAPVPAPVPAATRALGQLSSAAQTGTALKFRTAASALGSELGQVVDDSETDEHDLPPTLPPQKLRAHRLPPAARRLEQWLAGYLDPGPDKQQPGAATPPLHLGSPGDGPDSVTRMGPAGPVTQNAAASMGSGEMPFRRPSAAWRPALSVASLPMQPTAWDSLRGGTGLIDLDDLKARRARHAAWGPQKNMVERRPDEPLVCGEQGRLLEAWLVGRGNHSFEPKPVPLPNPLAVARASNNGADACGTGAAESAEPVEQTDGADTPLALATHASIRLALATDPGRLDSILEQHGVSPQRWSMFKQWLNERSAEERRRLGEELVDVLGDVERVAQERAELVGDTRRLDVDAYARIHVLGGLATDEAERVELLASKDLTTESWQQERSAWKLRCRQDAELRKRLRRAIATERRRRLQTENQQV